MKFKIIYCIFFLCWSFSIIAQGNRKELPNKITEWVISNLWKAKLDSIQVYGSPIVLPTKYGKAVEFNGKNDAIFINQMPLAGLEKFTVEMIFKPCSNGEFEQRMFHCGEISSSRVLLELRSTSKGWYFDGFIKAGEQSKALIDSTLLHKFNRWYHVAFVVNSGNLSTYVDGVKELDAKIDMAVFSTGVTSIGVRQNMKSWYKGLIYKIRITDKALVPHQFTKR